MHLAHDASEQGAYQIDVESNLLPWLWNWLPGASERHQPCRFSYQALRFSRFVCAAQSLYSAHQRAAPLQHAKAPRVNDCMEPCHETLFSHFRSPPHQPHHRARAAAPRQDDARPDGCDRRNAARRLRRLRSSHVDNLAWRSIRRPGSLSAIARSSTPEIGFDFRIDESCATDKRQ